jgi:DNA-binding LytR/AlgR family response regulator
VKVLIVDDEPAARRRLASLVEEVDPSIEIVAEAPDGLAAIQLADARRPDVVLLDIAMREVDGFDVARHLADPRPLIIFQTAFQEFAVKAFDYEALDYLVKPVKRERLAQALERARQRIAVRQGAGQGSGWDRAALDRFGAAIGYRPGPTARLLVRHAGGHKLVPLAEIAWFSAADGLVRAHTQGASWVVDYTIGELEARVGRAFVRASRAALVNLAAIDRSTSDGDGSATLVLKDGTKVHVSRRRAAEVWKLLEG